MEIKTKFDIGQIVYFLIGKDIEFGMISEINICDGKIEYRIDNGYYTMEEQSLLETLDGAINKLRNMFSLEVEEKIIKKIQEAEERLKDIENENSKETNNTTTNL